MSDSIYIGKFLLTFMLFPKMLHFGITLANYEELKAYGIGLNIGAGTIIIGYLYD